MSDTTKKYLDLPGLQEYDAGVKDALSKKANTSDLANYLTVANASATYATKEDLANVSVDIVVDDALSDTSTNPVQNKVITEEIQGLKEDLNSCLTEEDLGNDQDIYEAKEDLIPTCDAVNAYLNDFYLPKEDDGDSLTIADGAGNIVAQIDRSGINSIDYFVKGINISNIYATIASLEKYLKLSGGSVTGDLSVAGSFLVGGKPTARYLGNNSPYLFIGTTAEYEAANTAGTIPVGTIVIITDDDDNSSDDITTAVLGTAKLGYMILGSGSGSSGAAI